MTEQAILKLNASGKTLLYSTYLGGGSGDDNAFGVTVDQGGNAYVAGVTASTDFPPRFPYHPALQGPQDAFVAGFASGSHFLLQGAVPNHGGNGGTAILQIIGDGFTPGATSTLVCPGQPSITGTNPVVGGSGGTLTVAFDLVTAAPGICDIVVANVDGATLTARQAFTIEQGGGPRLWTDVLSDVNFEVGTEQTATFVVGNSGNVAALGVPITISLPLGAAVNLRFSITSPPATPGLSPINWSQVPPIVQTPTAQLLPLFIPAIPAGQSINLSIGLTLPAGTARHTLFNLSVSANAPYFGALSSPAQAFSQAGSCVNSLVGFVMNAIGIVVPTSCLSAAANTVYSLYRTLVISAPTGMVAPLSQAQLILSVARTASACIAQALGYTTGLPQLIAAVQTAISAAQTWMACKPVALALLQAQALIAGDPNYIAGRPGEGTQRWISGASSLAYLISFENEPTATAPAHHVTVSNSLDPNIDLSTLQLTGIDLAGRVVPINTGLVPAAGLNTFQAVADLRPTQNLLVKIAVTLGPATRTLTWDLTSIDPATGQPPTDVTVGLLPPGARGTLTFSVAPAGALPTGTQIQDQANVVFDSNAPVPTAVWLNTVDSTAPTSRMTALATTEISSSFLVSWSGTDVGSGIQNYTVYVSDNGAAFTPFQTDTTATSATFTGEVGHTYRFYSIARDVVGNIESPKTTTEATTSVQTGIQPVITSAANATFSRGTAGSFRVTSTGTPVAQMTRTGALPAGLIFTDNKNGTATIAGTPTLSGTFPMTITATNSVGSATQRFTLTVTQDSAKHHCKRKDRDCDDDGDDDDRRERDRDRRSHDTDNQPHALQDLR